MPFLHQLRYWAEHEPRRDACVLGGQALSYAELADASLSPTGSGRRRIVPLDAAHSADFIRAFVSAVAQGHCMAVLDPGWPPVLRREVLDRLSRVKVDEDIPGGVFYCGFTSGTTGVPKAFLRDTDSWQRSLARSVRLFGTVPGSRVLVPGPLSASLSLYALAECLVAGATYCTDPQETGPGFAHVVAVPGLLRQVFRRQPERWSTVQRIVAGGSKLEPSDERLLRTAAPEADIFEYYGASELGFIAARKIPRDGEADTDNHGDSAGRLVGPPFPGVEVRIDHEPGSKAGTVWVRSDLMFSGYLWGDDGAALRREGDWATVGDLGWLDAQDELHITGRAGEMLITAGHNVYPQEVEQVLVEAANLASGDVVVVGLPDRDRGHRLAAILRLAPGAPEPVLSELRRRAAAKLPDYKVPRLFYRTESWPLTAQGKISRTDLAARIGEGNVIHGPL